MIVKFTSSVLLGSGLGFVAGAFAPAVGRKIKALFVKTTQAVDKQVYSDYDLVKNKVEGKIKKL